MKLTITINFEGAAVDDDPMNEAHRILLAVDQRLQGSIGVEHEAGNLFNLRDINGNTIGTVDLIEGEDED